MSLQAIIGSLKGTIINPLISILVGVGFILFFWGIANYLFLMSGDVKKKDDAKQFMLWGVIIITVMISVWGIVQLLQGIFLGGANFSSPPAIPKIGGSSNSSDWQDIPVRQSPEDAGSSGADWQEIDLPVGPEG